MALQGRDVNRYFLHFRDYFSGLAPGFLTPVGRRLPGVPPVPTAFFVAALESHAQFAESAAHEYSHEFLQLKVGRTTQEDWVADGIGTLMSEWVAKEEEIEFRLIGYALVGSEITTNIYERGEALGQTGNPNDWLESFGQLWQLPYPLREYILGVAIGGFASGTASRIALEKTILDRDSRYQLALQYLVLLSKHLEKK